MSVDVAAEIVRRLEQRRDSLLHQSRNEIVPNEKLEHEAACVDTAARIAKAVIEQYRAAAAPPLEGEAALRSAQVNFAQAYLAAEAYHEAYSGKAEGQGLWSHKRQNELAGAWQRALVVLQDETEKHAAVAAAGGKR